MHKAMVRMAGAVRSACGLRAARVEHFVFIAGVLSRDVGVTPADSLAGMQLRQYAIPILLLDIH
jgi:hypothetical protein